MNCHCVGEEEWDRHHNEHLPSINTECAVTARTKASQRTLCSADGAPVRLWQAVSHSMSSNGRLSNSSTAQSRQWFTEEAIEGRIGND